MKKLLALLLTLTLLATATALVSCGKNDNPTNPPEQSQPGAGGDSTTDGGTTTCGGTTSGNEPEGNEPTGGTGTTEGNEPEGDEPTGGTGTTEGNEPEGDEPTGGTGTTEGDEPGGNEPGTIPHTHVDEDENGFCDDCRSQILTDAEYANVDAFIEYFNNYLKNAGNRSKKDLLTSNTRFDNITYSGSMAIGAQYSSITVYDGISHYIFNDSREGFTIDVDGGIMAILYNNGTYSYSGASSNNIDSTYESGLPSITRNDIILNSDGTLSISDEYMKSLYTEWVNSDVQSAWRFGNRSISYDSLISFLAHSEFETTVIWQNGKMSAYHIVLEGYGTTLYSFDFETSDTQTVVDMTMDQIGMTFTSSFVYVKGENGYATLDAQQNYPNLGYTYDYHARVDVITDLPDFVYNDDLLEAIESSRDLAAIEVALLRKYDGEFTYQSNCQNIYFIVYDEEYETCVVFLHAGNNKYKVAQITNEEYSSASIFCLVSADLENKTLTAIEHCDSERLQAILAEKYAGEYTFDSDGEYEGAIAYDSEYEVYVIFVKFGNVLKCMGCAKAIEDDSIFEIAPLSTVNITTKVITKIQ